ncbi:type II toxin-antitoxin system prevent-host-death family antitoxin [Azoarcus sp. PA01]|nr:type II toxin-antitoxin system prevent-host-death family antitoxin [Azoarcus sp. PA01]
MTSFMTNREQVMRTVSLAEAKAHFSELVTQVAGGEEVVITRHGQPIVRLSGVEKTKVPLASRARFRAQLQRLEHPSATLIRSLRDEER